jgi:ATP-dependent DNA helicase RecG
MKREELVSGLSACLGEAAPDPAQRMKLGAELRAWAASLPAGDKQLDELGLTIERADTRSQLALAAARAMRVLAQAPAEQAPDNEPQREEAHARGRSYLERMQERSLAQDQRDATPAGRPVECLPGIGPSIGLALRARGVSTLADLAWLLPLGYHDESQVLQISELVTGQRQVTEGRVVSAGAAPRGRARRTAEVLLEQADGGPGQGSRLRLVWFRAAPGLLARFRDGERFRVAGLVERYSGMASMTHPQTERLGAGDAARAPGIVPRYPLIPGVPPRTLARAIAIAVERCAPGIADAVPAALRAEHGLGPVGDALRNLHRPPAELNADSLARWNEQRTEHHQRMAFEEFFLLELGLHLRRVEEQGVRGEPLLPNDAALARARGALGFELTAAQQRVVSEIARDLGQERPMRRLLQGDVGSGKTAVAMLAAAHAISAGAQVAFMAPTEVLAEQHFRALQPLAQAMGLGIALVLGGERASHRKKTRKALEEGRLDLVVGTHALLSEGVRFARLRLVVVDEQHRFGVSQRLRLLDKALGVAAHLLVMTATPIPRSLALALHGDLSASVIDELPPGRVPPTTRAYPFSGRAQALKQLARGLEAGGQAFVVCPTIEPNEETGLRSVQETFDELSQDFAAFGVALLHGRLPAEEKQRAMERFVRGEAKLLVATTVIEVGVDVPLANVMLIEHAERFGLAQLHQLRGRVGRGGQRSACLLVHEASGEESRERIRILCESHDGFRIAEEDLKLRGPGELFGRRQSGLPGFRFGDLRRDLPLLHQAQTLARTLIENDPQLELPEHAESRRALSVLAESERALVKEEAG